jgi:lysophospholipase L1-like esterase
MASILVFGNSDSDGSALASQEIAWPWIVGKELREKDVVHKRFYATAPGAVGYLNRQLAAESPDTIILSITLYAFSVKTVANRIRRVAGTGAGNWAERKFNWFDSKTQQRSNSSAARSSARRKLNRAAHGLARRVIGTAPEASAQQVLDAYTAAIVRLAREEQSTVVVIGSLPFTEILERRNPKARSMQESFNRRIATVCRKHHVAWVDPEFLRDPDVESLYSDSLHLTATAHGRVAGEVLRAVGRG